MPVTSLPSGNVVFVFTDIVSSTRLWDEATAMSDALLLHDELLTSTFRAHGGYVFSTTGDGFGVAFQDPVAAITASVAAQQALRRATWPEGATIKIRMGIHGGVAEERDENYFGPPVNRAARLMSVADAHQILISRHVTDQTSGALNDEIELVALGAVSLKDIAEPVEVFSVRAEGVEVAQPPSPGRQANIGNLPLGTTEIVGRATDITTVLAALATTRVVSLVGPGGVGKTSLAIDVARRFGSAPDGRWIVRLSSITDATAVLTTVHAALGQSNTATTIEQLIAESLRDRNMLLVLDNCEHVLDEVGRLVEAIVAGTPNVKVLATSREPLHVRDERLVPVLPLTSDPAVELFIRRAAQAGAHIEADIDVDAVHKICRRLDGLPLAIELAAAKARALSPPALLELLDDRFELLKSARPTVERHRTLRDTFDWSYELLDDRERRVLDRLGVFATPFDIGDATAVCVGDGISQTDVFEAVLALADKSLITSTRSTPSFTLLDSIRELARERLGDGASADRARDLHTERMRELAAHVRADCVGPKARQVAGLVDVRSADFEAATRWATSHGEISAALDIVIDLNAMGSQRGWRHAPRWVSDVLEDPPDPLPAQWPDFLAASAATALHEHGALDRARALADRAIELDDDNPQALLVLAHLASRPGECYALATRLFESGTRRGELNWRLDGLSYQAFGLLVTGDYDETLDVARQLGVEGEACGDLTTVGWSRYFTARALSPSDPARALVMLEEAREIADRTANRNLEISSRRQRVATLIAGEDPEAALASIGRLILRTLELGEADQALRTCAMAGIAFALVGRDDDSARIIGRLGLPVRTRDDLIAYRRLDADLTIRLGERNDTVRSEWLSLPATRTIELVLAALD